MDREMLLYIVECIFKSSLQVGHHTLTVQSINFTLRGHKFHKWIKFDKEMDLYDDFILCTKNYDKLLTYLLQYLNDINNKDNLVEFKYIVPPGPFNYAELILNTPQAMNYMIFPYHDESESFITPPNDDINEYLAQYGIYDITKPIPDSYSPIDTTSLLIIYKAHDIMQIGG